MKLELKHLAVYLTAGINVRLVDTPLGDDIRKLQLDCGHDFNSHLQQGKVRPILKPIQSIPENVLQKMFLIEWGLVKQPMREDTWYVKRYPAYISISHYGVAVESKWDIFFPEANPYAKLEFLASHGYDVFNLIDAGLADIEKESAQ